MVILDNWLILKDGSVKNISNGQTQYFKRNKQGKKYFLLKDNTGKTHFWLQHKLLELYRNNNNISSTTSVQTVFSKGDLKQQNRKGVYVPTKNRNPIISLSAYILKGSDRGKKLSELSLDRLNWYNQTLSADMNCNELLELNTEISKRKV